MLRVALGVVASSSSSSSSSSSVFKSAVPTIARTYSASNNGRALQDALDTHRLHMLTTLAEDRSRSTDDPDPESIVRETSAMTHEARGEIVGRRLRENVVRMARAMARVGDFKGGDWEKRVEAHRAAATREVGHHCFVAKSKVEGVEAGNGLFVRGSARAGTVVATYPGLTYVGTAMKYMNGYPRVSKDNDYLIVRTDGSVIDAKPWGMGVGGEDEAQGWPGPPLEYSAERLDEFKNASFLQRLMHPTLSEETRLSLLNECKSLERANVFAYAHLANHPPKGTLPNVVVASVDVQADADIRPYIPNVNVMPDDEENANESVWSIVTDGERTLAKRAQDVAAALFGEDEDAPKVVKSNAAESNRIRSLVLVATRDISDGEEILLNYRLSTHVTPPSWYTRVDAEEDARRWS
jgi:hypothetical protein